MRGSAAMFSLPTVPAVSAESGVLKKRKETKGNDRIFVTQKYWQLSDSTILCLGHTVSEMSLQDKNKSPLWYNWNQRLFRRRWGKFFFPPVQEVEGIYVWNLASALLGKKADSKVYSGVCELCLVRGKLYLCVSSSHTRTWVSSVLCAWVTASKM